MKLFWKNICNELVICWNRNTIITPKTLKMRIHYPVSLIYCASVLPYLFNCSILIHSIWEAIYGTINFWHQVDCTQFHIVFMEAFLLWQAEAWGLSTVISLVDSEKYYGNGKILWRQMTNQFRHLFRWPINFDIFSIELILPLLPKSYSFLK